jgi:hypothetical protein
MPEPTTDASRRDGDPSEGAVQSESGDDGACREKTPAPPSPPPAATSSAPSSPSPPAKKALRFRAAALQALRREAAAGGEEPVTAVRSNVGTGATLAGVSLGIFAADHPLRIRVFRMLYRQSTELALVALILAHFAVLTLSASEGGGSGGGGGGYPHAQSSHGDDYSQKQQPPTTDASQSSHSWSAPEIADVAILGVYTLETCLRVFALGLCRHKYAYLRNAYNRLDALVVAASWVLILVAGAVKS